ncbi:MAG TPA: hypothetical protein VGP07_00195 [Polyangia bacterium]|jgi:hypothetical protein
MTRGRRWLVCGFLMGLGMVHGYEIVRDGEHWPFCSYGMYSSLQAGRVVESYRAVGVLANGDELPLQDEAVLFPFDPSRLSSALHAMADAPGGGERLRLAAADLLRRYEARRRAGLHDGPAISRIRLIFTRHELEPGARKFARPLLRLDVADVASGSQ